MALGRDLTRLAVQMATGTVYLFTFEKGKVETQVYYNNECRLLSILRPRGANPAVGRRLSALKARNFEISLGGRLSMHIRSCEAKRRPFTYKKVAEADRLFIKSKGHAARASLALIAKEYRRFTEEESGVESRVLTLKLTPGVGDAKRALTRLIGYAGHEG